MFDIGRIRGIILDISNQKIGRKIIYGELQENHYEKDDGGRD